MGSLSSLTRENCRLREFLAGRRFWPFFALAVVLVIFFMQPLALHQYSGQGSSEDVTGRQHGATSLQNVASAFNNNRKRSRLNEAGDIDEQPAAPQQKPTPRQKSDLLVVYLFGISDKHYQRNFQFFVEHGMDANDGIEYVVIVQQVHGASAHYLSPSPTRTFCSPSLCVSSTLRMTFSTAPIFYVKCLHRIPSAFVG
jgi:hypothetical protein